MQFYINTNATKEAVKEYIDRLPEGKTFDVVIKLCRPVRTLDQNRLYWLWLACIADETGNNANDLHEVFKQKFLPSFSADIMGVNIHRTPSTRELNTAQFTTYLNEIQAYMAQEFGIILPLPEDRFYEEFVKQYGR